MKGICQDTRHKYLKSQREHALFSAVFSTDNYAVEKEGGPSSRSSAALYGTTVAANYNDNGNPSFPVIMSTQEHVKLSLCHKTIYRNTVFIAEILQTPMEL